MTYVKYGVKLSADQKKKTSQSFIKQIIDYITIDKK